MQVSRRLLAAAASREMAPQRTWTPEQYRLAVDYSDSKEALGTIWDSYRDHYAYEKMGLLPALWGDIRTFETATVQLIQHALVAHPQEELGILSKTARLWGCLAKHEPLFPVLFDAGSPVVQAFWTLAYWTMETWSRGGPVSVTVAGEILGDCIHVCGASNLCANGEGFQLIHWASSFLRANRSTLSSNVCDSLVYGLSRMKGIGLAGQLSLVHILFWDLLANEEPSRKTTNARLGKVLQGMSEELYAELQRVGDLDQLVANAQFCPERQLDPGQVMAALFTLVLLMVRQRLFLEAGVLERLGTLSDFAVASEDALQTLLEIRRELEKVADVQSQTLFSDGTTGALWSDGIAVRAMLDSVDAFGV